MVYTWGYTPSAVKCFPPFVVFLFIDMLILSHTSIVLFTDEFLWKVHKLYASKGDPENAGIALAIPLVDQSNKPYQCNKSKSLLYGHNCIFLFSIWFIFLGLTHFLAITEKKISKISNKCMGNDRLLFPSALNLCNFLNCNFILFNR